MKCVLSVLILLSAAVASAKDITGPLDQYGNRFKLSSWGEDRLVVVAFLNVDCPLGQLYTNRLNELHATYANRGVCFIAVNSNDHDTYESMCQFAKSLNFTVLKDSGYVVADEFGATRSPEVFLLDAGRDVIYSGRIDDQYAPGVHTRKQPTRHDLEEAIKEALAFQPVSTPHTTPSGCHIERTRPAPQSLDVTYTKHIAPIFDAKCAECHRPGEVAPFSLLTYEDASARTGTIGEVIETKRMPPWGAAKNPDGIHFANDRSLTEKEQSLILSWIEAGAPEGNPVDRPSPPQFVSGWSIKPDVILTMPEPFLVPKEGLLEYQEFAIEPGFAEDVWVSALEIRPGNRKVVHHATIYVKPKNAPKGMFYFDQHADHFLAMYAPGNTSTVLPFNGAKLIPAGWNLHLSIHYVPTGTEQTDQSSIGLTLAADPLLHIATRPAVKTDLVLNPGEVKRATAELKVEEDYLLTALYPHMHLRGKSMLFQAFYPNGSVQTLLNVPAYDFEWQHRYILAEPIVLPAGTTLRCTAHFDNSAANKTNPDPTATVRSGILTTDEMLLGIFELGHLRNQPKPASLAAAYGVLAIAGVLVIVRRSQHSSAKLSA